MKIDKNVLKSQAQGRWLEIFQYVCPGVFSEAIDKLGSHVHCPLHGGENDFRFVKRAKAGRENTAECGVAMCTCGVFHDGFSVIQAASGMSFPEVCIEVHEYLNGASPTKVKAIQALVPKIVKLSEEEQADLDAQVLARVHNLWSAARPLELSQGAYYRARGMQQTTLNALQDVRFMASLGYFNQKGDREGSYPALLALLRNAQGQAVAVHRTWLSKDLLEKAPVPKAKKLTQTPGVQGGAIRLFDAEGATCLGLTEGIETGLAAWQLSKVGYWPELQETPVWACFAERNLRSFEIPEYLLETLVTLVVFADNDENGKGLEAATALKARMAELHPALNVVIKLPTVVGWDFNDVLLNLA